MHGALGLVFNYRPFSASTRLRFVGPQYATLMNDKKMPAFVTDDLSFGYQLPSWTHLPGPKLQLNLVNITNSLFRDGVYQFQYNAQEVVGIKGGKIAPSGSPTYYVAPYFAGIVSLTQRF